ncbi:MAG: TetR/AcrR family transcriptional regulator [Ferrovibrio sp.]
MAKAAFKTAPYPLSQTADALSERGTRQRALVAALALFDVQGVEATTIDQVRDAADVSVGSLYHHFGSREGLVIALYQDLLERYRAAMAAELARHSGVRALLDEFVKTHIAWSMLNPTAARFLAEHRHHRTLSDAEHKLQSGTTDFLRPLLRRLKPAMDAGVLKPLPPELLLSLVVGPVQNWLRMQRADRASLNPGNAARKLADLIWDAIAVAPTKRKLK